MGREILLYSTRQYLQSTSRHFDCEIRHVSKYMYTCSKIYACTIFDYKHILNNVLYINYMHQNICTQNFGLYINNVLYINYMYQNICMQNFGLYIYILNNVYYIKYLCNIKNDVEIIKSTIN